VLNDLETLNLNHHFECNIFLPIFYGFSLNVSYKGSCVKIESLVKGVKKVETQPNYGVFRSKTLGGIRNREGQQSGVPMTDYW
jgi:hypothetical protein